MRLPSALPILACLLFPAFPAFAGEQAASSFSRKVELTLALDYLIALPEGYATDESKTSPLLVFLHGAGERGADLEKVKIHGPPKMISAGESLPFIVVSPQCPEGEWWTEQPVLELIDHIEATHRVDPERIYLTGLSMGGYGTWHFASEAPYRFAAIAPICGGGTPYKMRWIRHLPVWAFHGARDVAVPLEESTRLVDALKKRGNTRARVTVYPEAGHDSWTESYANPELYDWLLSHRRVTEEEALRAEAEAKAKAEAKKKGKAAK